LPMRVGRMSDQATRLWCRVVVGHGRTF
jgi:hypothetical protein